MSGQSETVMRILEPALVTVALTFAVWLRMFFSRVGEMKRQRIHPQAVATSAQMAARMSDTRAADNFRNLFELPVLFYFGVLVAAMTGADVPVLLAFAWVFAASRILHSAIHCTYNKVMHRFYAYLLGGVALAGMWLVIAFRVLTQ